MKWKADQSMANCYFERDKEDWVEYLNGTKVSVFKEVTIASESGKNPTVFLYRNTTMYLLLTQYKGYLYDCANYTRVLETYNGQWVYDDNYTSGILLNNIQILKNHIKSIQI